MGTVFGWVALVGLVIMGVWAIATDFYNARSK